MPYATPSEQLVAYLTDVHSTEEHERLIRGRLEAHDADPSKLKDLAQKGSAMATGALAKSAPDTTGKLAIQAYAFEHLEIASYRMLRVVAERAGDQETVEVADRILQQEQHAASTLDALLDDVSAYDVAQQEAAA